MVEIPSDVWHHIALFIPDEDIRDRLLGVNPVLYDLSLRLRYETVSISEVGEATIWMLNRLCDPAISWRVRKLTFRPHYRIRKSVRTAGSDASPQRDTPFWRSMARWVAGRSMRRSSPPPDVQRSANFAKMERITSLLVEVIPHLTNVVDFGLDAWNIPPEADIRPLVTAAWQTFAKKLTTTSLVGYPGILNDIVIACRPQFDSLESLSLDLTHDLYNRNTGRDPSEALLELIPFINRVAPQLREFCVATWTPADLSSFFNQMPAFPLLNRFFIRALFQHAFATDAEGLTRLLSNSTTLQHVELKLRSTAASPASEAALASWLSSASNDHPTMLKNLKTLHVDPTAYPIGFDAVKQILGRSSRTLTHLVIRDRYLFHREVDVLLKCVDEATSIETIQINVHMLSTNLLQLLSARCPKLRTLTLYIGHLGMIDGDSQASEVPSSDMFRAEIRHQCWRNWPVEDLDIWQGGSKLDESLMRLLAAAIPNVQKFWGNALPRPDVPGAPS